MRVGVVIDDLDRRRGGMSEWSWQFVWAAAARGYELHIVAQGFGVEPLPARSMRHRIDRTSSRLAFAESASPDSSQAQSGRRARYGPRLGF